MTGITYQLRACVKESDYGLTHLATARLPDGRERDVVIKILQPRLTQDPVLLSHLAGYLDVARGLLRPGIAPIWDFGQAGEYCFLVREYLPGVSLDQVFRLVAEGRVVLSPAMAVYLVREIAAAITAIHRYRVPGDQPIYLFHGGLSPHNVILTRIGDTVVTDAGMDVILWRDDHAVNTLRQRKAAYHPPEYLAGQRPMRRGDTYGVAALLYQMVVGLSPKDAIQQAGHGGFVLPSHQNSRVTAAFDELLFSALHPSADKRMIQIERFLQALSEPSLLRQNPVSLREAMEYIEVLVREESASISLPSEPPFFDTPFHLQTLLPLRNELPPPHERYRPPQFEDTGPFHPVSEATTATRPPSRPSPSGQTLPPLPPIGGGSSLSAPPTPVIPTATPPSSTFSLSPTPLPPQSSGSPASLPLGTPEQTAAVPFAAIFGSSPSSDILDAVDEIETTGTSETVAAPSPLSKLKRALLPQSEAKKESPLAFQETAIAPHPPPPSVAKRGKRFSPAIPSEAPDAPTPNSPPVGQTQPVLIPSFEVTSSDDLETLQPVEDTGEDGEPRKETTISLSLEDLHHDEGSLRQLLEKRVQAKALADRKLQDAAATDLHADDTPESLDEIPEVADDLQEDPLSSFQDEITPPQGLPSSNVDPHLPSVEEDDDLPDPATIASLSPVGAPSSILHAVPSAAPLPAGFAAGSNLAATVPVSSTAPTPKNLPPYAMPPSQAPGGPPYAAAPTPGGPPYAAAPTPGLGMAAKTPSSAEAEEPEEEQERFGKFVLLSRVALGGMAEVFKAKVEGPEGFQRLVAVKRILPEYSQDTTFIEMFKDEARIAGSLLHPHIVQIFELGEVEGTYFISMEFIDGIDLARVIKIRRALNLPIPLGVVLTIGLAVCRALQYAHDERDLNGQPLNMIHRDVTPHNVLLSRKGEIKLTDFGIAKAAQNVTQTAVGELKGKLSYMSPEQAAGRTLDRRSDLFQVGILIYELLTLRKMFEGNSDQTLLLKIQNGDYAPIRELIPDLHTGFEGVLLKALAGTPEERYQSASELEGALLSFRDRFLSPTERLEVAPFVHEILQQRDDLLSQYAASRKQQKQTFSVLEDPQAAAAVQQVIAAQQAPSGAALPPSQGFEAARALQSAAHTGGGSSQPFGSPTLSPSFYPAEAPRGPSFSTAADPLIWPGDTASASKTRKRSPLFLIVGFLFLLGLAVTAFFFVGGEAETKDALLTINSNPPDAVVRLDGLEIGRTPIFEKKLPYDKDPHLIQIHKEGYQIYSREIRLRSPGEETTLSAILLRLAPKPPLRPAPRFIPAPSQPTPIPLPPLRSRP